VISSVSISFADATGENMLMYDAERAAFFSEFASGCRKKILSVRCGRIRHVTRGIVAFVFALDHSLRKAFYLDLMIAVGIAWGAVCVILWYEVQKFLVIPVNRPSSL
jgi:hypothetical protein